jgi:hypothetical protein
MRVKDWDKFQHYKSGKNAKRPEWIKLYRKILDDIEWHELDPADAKALVMLWLLASENGGNLPTVKEIGFRLRLSEAEITSTLQRLTHWLDGVPSECLDVAYAESRLEENKKENKNRIEGEGACAPLAANGSHAFKGNVVRLNAQDFESWKGAYRNLDLEAELLARDAWLAEHPERQGNWFASTSKYLANRNAEARARAQAPPQHRRSPLMEAGESLIKEFMEKDIAASLDNQPTKRIASGN